MFLAKFIAIDANGLNIIMKESNISFVHKPCKKDIASKAKHKAMDVLNSDSSSVEQVIINGFCVSQFQLQQFSWGAKFSEKISVYSTFLTSTLSFLYLENTLPPPRWV